MRNNNRLILLFLALAIASPLAAGKDLDVLFLGDDGPHVPRQRFEQLAPVMAARGIKLTYTDNVRDLNESKLAQYDALLLYANIDRIEPDQAQALLDYVAGGGGFVPLHCATYCFRNSDEVVALMGGQFQRHGTGTFRAAQVKTDHPIMRGFGGFESWDETYVHHLHNERNRTVLEYRVDSEGREPWTWIRTHGDGRVFYTAWGHDQRTWGNPGFQNLVERGIRWAAGDALDSVPAYLADQPFPVPELTARRSDVQPFEYIDVGAKIPIYTPNAQWGTQEPLQSKMQKPLPPAEAIKHMRVPIGFHLELFASEPDLGGKPICMAWDERGRLWVAETYDYPNELQPEDEGRDRVRVCEDTDHDGRADKFTVFASKLSIPTSITFHRGGAIIQEARRTLYLRDTDGDDRADERQVLFTGWGVGDTHGVVSNFQYGLDNWIWAMQGYNHSEPVVAGVKQQAFRQGFFRFRPDGSQLEFIRSTNNNTWGLGISEEGIIFGSTANRNPSVYMPIANRYYEAVRGWKPSLQLGSIAKDHYFKPVTDKIRQMDHHGGYTAAAGHALYTARNYPPEYWNRVAFVNGPTGHLVGSFVLKRDGSDFHSAYEFNLAASDDEWSAPIMSEVGPDGDVWIIDWYNYIVQHNPTPRGFPTGKGNAYVTDLRDKKHGRIYRLVHDEAAAAQPMSLAGAPPAELVATLAHPNMFWRRQAQRLLVERGDADVVPALVALAGDHSVDQIGLNVGAIHALWTIHGLGALDGTLPVANAAAIGALQHPSPGVRRNAVQVLPRTAESLQALLAAGLITDSDPQVRLATLLSLAEMPPQREAAEAIAAALTNPVITSDRWLPEAATCAAAQQAEEFLIAAGKLAQISPQLADTTRIVANHFARQGNDKSLPRLVDSLTAANQEIAAAVIEGLDDWPAESPPEINAALTADLERLAETVPLSARGRLAQLARRWGSDRFEKYLSELTDFLLATVEDSEIAAAERLAAANRLAEMQMLDGPAVERLLQTISPQTPPAVAAGLVTVLEQSEADEVGDALLSRFPNLTPAVRGVGIQVLLRRPRLSRALLEGIEQGRVELSELSLDQKQSLSAHPNAEIRDLARAVFARGGALPSPDRQRVLESLLSVTHQTGDAAAGKQAFIKHCGKCHVHGDEGVRIGPDLTGMAVHPKEELLTQIIDPNRNVEGNYRIYTVETSDGVILSGLLASESRTAIELIDTEGKKKTLLREEIDDLVASRKSLMPEGFEQQLTTEELTNLLEFLTKRGRFLPLPLAKAATITSVRGMFNDPESRAERLVFADWKPQTFAGVPFVLVDPQQGRLANAILLHGPQGAIPPIMPKSVELVCNAPAKMIHLLSGVSGWGHPLGEKGSVSMIVRLHYADGEIEDHPLKNGEHFADYIRRVDVPSSQFAFDLRGKQLRYLTVEPRRSETIKTLELVKGDDATAPIVMAITLDAGE